MKLTKRAMIIPAASLLLLGGCAKPSAYKDPISKFQTASTVVISGARVEYHAVNKRERDALIDKSVAEEKKITLSDINKTRFLKPDDLATRMAALYALERHGQLLFKLANSDAPDEAKQAVRSFDDAVLKLSSSLGQAPSSEFKAKAGAFATIAGEVTKLALNAKIDQALKKAITLSENNVLGLITLIENEMAAFHERQRAILSEARVLATDEYNKEAGKEEPASEELKKAATVIKQAEDAWEKSTSPLSSIAFETMRDAHQKLVSYAKKDPKTPEDLAELVAAMDAFADQAKIIADAIKTIQQ